MTLLLCTAPPPYTMTLRMRSLLALSCHMRSLSRCGRGRTCAAFSPSLLPEIPWQGAQRASYSFCAASKDEGSTCGAASTFIFVDDEPVPRQPEVDNPLAKKKRSRGVTAG